MPDVFLLGVAESFSQLWLIRVSAFIVDYGRTGQNSSLPRAFPRHLLHILMYR